MIRIYPDFFTEEEFNRIVGTLDLEDLQEVPNSTNTWSCPSRFFKVRDKVSQFGNITFQELLLYRTGGKSNLHIDGKSYAGGLDWKYTGILFCNENYSGGELWFSKLGIKLKCPKNTFIVFPAGVDSHLYEHGVTEVTGGERMTAIFRFTE